MRTDLIKRNLIAREIKRQEAIAWEGEAYIRRDAVLEKIDMAPSVEEHKVTHAAWEMRKNMIVCSGDNGCYEGLRWHVYTRDICFGRKLPKYCPFCGAKMDAKEVDHEPIHLCD